VCVCVCVCVCMYICIYIYIYIYIYMYIGEFPLWLAPEQLRLLPINDEVAPYCEKVAKGMRAKVQSTL